MRLFKQAWAVVKRSLTPGEEEGGAEDTYQPTRSLDQSAQEQVQIKQTPVVSEQLFAPLDTKPEQFENVFGPAVIKNESSRTVKLRNDLLFLVLAPGQTHVLHAAILQQSYDNTNRVKTLARWDPLNTLKDLIAEYERAQDPMTRYNWSQDALVECSQLKAFRLRGAKEQKGTP